MKEALAMKMGRTISLKTISYWATTIITASELLAGGAADLLHGRTALVAGEPVTDVLAQLGYPVYLLTILGAWKVAGAVALLVPRFPRLKEWAYAGTVFVYTGAIVSGVIRGSADLASFPWTPLILALFALASWAQRPPARTLSPHAG